MHGSLPYGSQPPTPFPPRKLGEESVEFCDKTPCMKMASRAIIKIGRVNIFSRKEISKSDRFFCA